MNRPTVPPVRRRGEDPILDALADGRGDGMLLARMERRLRRVSWMPSPTPWTPEAPWTRRYARSLVLVTFALLAPGLVALSLVAVEWAKERLHPEAVAAEASVVATGPSMPSMPPGPSALAPTGTASEPAAGAPSVASPPPSASSLPEVSPSASTAHRPAPAPAPSPSASPSPPGAASAPSPPAPAGPLFTPELDY